MNAGRGRRRDSSSIQTFLYVMRYIWLTLKYGYTFIQNTYVVRLSGKIFFDSGTDLESFDSITHHSGHDLTTYQNTLLLGCIINDRAFDT